MGSRPEALILAEYGTLNGGEKSLLTILPDLMDHGWRFVAAVPDESPFACALADTKVAIEPFSFHESGQRKPLESLRDEIRMLISRRQPDLVHCNSLSVSRIAGPVCQSQSTPSVGYLRDIIKLNQKVIGDLNCLDAIVAVSNATADFHIAQGVGRDRMHVIYNGVDPVEFAPGEAAGKIRQELQLDAGSPLVLYVGQIGLRKGLDTWLEAARQISVTCPEVHFLMVGKRHSEKQESIDYEQQLIRQSLTTPLKDRVHWLGTRDDVADLMKQCSVLLHCARQEPLGRVLLEACASGLPVVATEVGGTPEILRESSLKSLMVPADAWDEAARATVRLLRDGEYHSSVSNCVRQIAIKQFPVAECSRQLLAQYDDVLNRVH